MGWAAVTGPGFKNPEGLVLFTSNGFNELPWVVLTPITAAGDPLGKSALRNLAEGRRRVGVDVGRFGESLIKPLCRYSINAR